MLTRPRLLLMSWLQALNAGALASLPQQDEVDPARLALLGFLRAQLK
jgi:hypothetical protein